jgi:hypothetical protein
MFSRVRDRLKRLKDQITPEGACSCSSGLRSRAFRPMPSSLRHSRTRTVSAHTTLSLRWSTKDKRCKGPLGVPGSGAIYLRTNAGTDADRRAPRRSMRDDRFENFNRQRDIPRSTPVWPHQWRKRKRGRVQAAFTSDNV